MSIKECGYSMIYNTLDNGDVEVIIHYCLIDGIRLDEYRLISKELMFNCIYDIYQYLEEEIRNKYIDMENKAYKIL